MTKSTTTITIPSTMFWRIHSHLVNMDNFLLEMYDPKDQDSEKSEQLSYAHMEVGSLLGKMETIVSSLKDIDQNSN